MGGIIVLKEKVINSLIISVVFAFNLCIFGPLEFFYSNIFEFWFSINQLLPIIIITFVVTSIIIFFLTYFTKNKLNSAIIRIIFILTVCLYIQGNYLNIGYNVLDGNDINWSSMIFKGIINTIIWVCIIIIPFAVKKMKEKAFFYKCSNIISAFIFLIEVITLITIIIMGTSSGSEKKTEFYLDATNIYNISNDENIIVFVSDAFEATYMNEILEKCPEYKEKLVDFTYFDNTTGASIRTSFSMPTMLTGNSFVLGKNMEQNIEYCFENTEVYDILKENNYDAELYTDTNLISAKEDKITNKIEKELIMKNESKYKIAELLYKCVLYKYLPHFLKSNFVVNTADFNNVNLEDANQYIFDDVKFKGKMWYEDLNIMLKITHNIKKISVIHKGYYLCNCRDNSTMRNDNSKKNLDMIWAIDDAKEYLIKNRKFNKDIYSYIVFNHILIETINRVESHKNKDKQEVIRVLNKYCKDNIKDYRKQDFYKKISRNRKIVAFLNYHKLSKISKILINIKRK